MKRFDQLVREFRSQQEPEVLKERETRDALWAKHVTNDWVMALQREFVGRLRAGNLEVWIEKPDYIVLIVPGIDLMSVSEHRYIEKGVEEWRYPRTQEMCTVLNFVTPEDWPPIVSMWVNPGKYTLLQLSLVQPPIFL